MKPLPEKDNTSFVKWDQAESPAKILIIRLHAIGDAAITLPACRSLRESFPSAVIDYLTTDNVKGLISAFNMFDHLYLLESGFELSETGYDNAGKKLARLSSAAQMGMELRKNKYDAVIDLQNSKYSSIVRRLSGAECYSGFDRYSSKPHSQRVIDSMHKAGFEQVENNFDLQEFENIDANGKKILMNNGWDGKRKIIVLNPAGAYETRMWGDENYSALGRLLVREGNMLMIMGLGKMKSRADVLKKVIGENLIDMCGRTYLADVPGILRHISGIVSDDSGLFHIAWAMGKPGVLLLGATRSDWACQGGNHAICLNSGDLECGNCMLEKCKWGDVRCLKRYSPEMVYEMLWKVMGN